MSNIDAQIDTLTTIYEGRVLIVDKHFKLSLIHIYKYYANEKFVRVLKKGVCPETKWVEGSNYVDVNFVIDERTGRIIMMLSLIHI